MTDETSALRDRIAEALAAVDGWAWTPDFDKTLSPVWQGYLKRADAVLAVLPASVDRADVLERAADFFRGLAATGTSITAAEAEAELRRMAAECPQCGDSGACNGGPCPLRRVAAETPNTTEHACSNCGGIDPDTCLTNPNRPRGETALKRAHVALAEQADRDQAALARVRTIVERAANNVQRPAARLARRILAELPAQDGHPADCPCAAPSAGGVRQPKEARP